MNPTKILLVDDSKSARYALRLQLQRHGVEVETADSAESALERISQAPPDAVFMDHTMPGMNGFEALEILKAEPATTNIPVVMCTSNEEPEFVAQAHRKGALDILAKSATPERLADLLTRLQAAAGASPAAPTAAAGETPASAESAPAPSMSAASVAEAASKAAREEVERLLGEQLEQRLPRLLEHHLSGLSAKLRAELADQAEGSLDVRVQAEAARLENHLAQSLAEKTRADTSRILNDSLPAMVRQHLDAALPGSVRQQLRHEETGIAQMVQELIDTSVDRLPEDPAFLRRLQRSQSATAASNTQETVRRHAREVAEEAASGHAGALTEALRQATRDNKRLIYLLATVAGLVGVASSAGVYLLLH
ncbi:MAG: response regulator [Chromatiaceae bacterium]|jgi:CheY-like chemotaxis protein